MRASGTPSYCLHQNKKENSSKYDGDEYTKNHCFDIMMLAAICNKINVFWFCVCNSKYKVFSLGKQNLTLVKLDSCF